MRVLLALLFAAAPVAAERRWSVDPGQTLVTVDAAPFSAFSHRLEGAMREVGGNGIALSLRMPLRSLTTGDVAQDRSLPREGELAFELHGPAASNGTVDLDGTVTFGDVVRPVRVRVGLVRTAAATFGHALLIVHLRDFGYPLPSGVRDAARIELDTALRPERPLASRGYNRRD